MKFDAHNTSPLNCIDFYQLRLTLRLRYAPVREKEEANATRMSGSAEILSGFSVYVEAPENLRGGEIFCVIVYSALYA